MPAPRRSVLALLTTAGVFSVALAFRAPEQPAAPAGDPGPLTATTSGPKFWKGNLHAHSLWSDGDDFPEMIADWYKRHGYDFLAMTEHNVIADGERWTDAETTPVRKGAVAKYVKRFGEAWVERRTAKVTPKGKDAKDEAEAVERAQVRLKPLREFRSLLEEPGKFLLVPGEEITHRYKTKPVHMNGINVRDTIKPIDGADVTETVRANIRQAEAAGRGNGWPNLVFLNHPNFGWGQTAEDMLAVEELKFFEVYNGHPGVRNYGDATHAGTEKVWDILLAVRLGKLKMPVVYGVGTDDSHGYHEFGLGKVNPGRGWCMVRAPYLSAEALVRAMHAGDFYFSSGVELADVRAKDGTLSVDIKGEAGVTYKTEFVATMKDANLDSKPLTGDDAKPLDVTRRYSDDVGKVVATSAELKASYKLTGKELYVRAKVTSSKPHPNPYQKGDVEMAWTQPVLP